MWAWQTKKCLVNLALCSRIELAPLRGGDVGVLAYNEREKFAIGKFKTEEEAVEFLGKLRAQLNRARKL